METMPVSLAGWDRSTRLPGTSLAPRKEVWLYEGVGISENIWWRGERTSSGDKLWSTLSSTAAGRRPDESPKMLSKSVRNMENTGAGMLRVGAKTMPTFLTVILFTSELFTIPIKKSDRARSRARFGLGNRCTRELKAATFFCRSSSSVSSELVLCPRTTCEEMTGEPRMTYQAPAENQDATPASIR